MVKGWAECWVSSPAPFDSGRIRRDARAQRLPLREVCSGACSVGAGRPLTARIGGRRLATRRRLSWPEYARPTCCIPASRSRRRISRRWRISWGPAIPLRRADFRLRQVGRPLRRKMPNGAFIALSAGPTLSSTRSAVRTAQGMEIWNGPRRRRRRARRTLAKDLVSWLAAGCKPEQAFRVGAEHEKIPFYIRDDAPVPYEGPRGIGALLAGMQAHLGWNAIEDDGALIGLFDPPAAGPFRSNRAASSSSPARRRRAFTTSRTNWRRI